jgi:hypothetical protein
MTGVQELLRKQDSPAHAGFKAAMGIVGIFMPLSTTLTAKKLPVEFDCRILMNIRFTLFAGALHGNYLPRLGAYASQRDVTMINRLIAISLFKSKTRFCVRQFSSADPRAVLHPART